MKAIHKRSLYSILLIVHSIIVPTLLNNCQSKEVELTNEWHLLQENETVPRGVHVKMDISTGEKWVKLAGKTEEKTGLIVTDQPNDKVLESVIEADGSLNILPDKEKDYISEDVLTIHRTLSQLPEDEQERIGGLPELPALPSPNSNITKEDYKKFEMKLKKIWELRQEELKQAQEELVADIPSIIKDRINALQSFIANGYVVSGENDHVAQVLFILKELEYDLSDIDMSRDFYTLGGWNVLLSLLQSDTHSNAIKHYSYTYPLEQIQTTVAWVIGTSIKNTQEFNNWILQPLPSYKNALELILSNTIQCSQSNTCNVDKYIYAIGSALRGNTLITPNDITISNHDTTQITLETILYNIAKSSIQTNNYNTISKVLVLIRDLNLSIQKDWCTIMQLCIRNYSENVKCLERSISFQEKILHSLKYVCDTTKENVKELVRSSWIECWYEDGNGIDIDWRMELIDFVNSL